MKTRLLLATLLVATLAATPAMVAAKGLPKIPGSGKNSGNKDKNEEPAAKYDTNHNGRIDGEEIAALQAAFDKDKNGPLKKYDTNHNGNLEKSEIAAIRFTPHTKK